MSFDWNNAAENAIAGALGTVPDVGSLLGALVYIFWPKTSENVWSEVEQQVEQLIDQKIDQLVYEQVQDSLTGLNNNLNDYLNAVSTGDLGTISDTWITTDGDFDQQLPSFQAENFELLLLPLFAQFANLHLALLRDGVLYGSSWGWTAAYQESIAQKLSTTITDYSNYVQTPYQQGFDSLGKKTKTNNHECEPFHTMNAYVRQMTFAVLDYVELWQYFDATKYPNPVSVYPSHEIYSDPVGTCDDSGPINLPSPPTQPISQLTIWGWDRIDAVQLTYPPGGGPGGVTQTARMGDQNGGSNQSPYGGVFNLDDNPVTIAAGSSGDILNAFVFTFQDVIFQDRNWVQCGGGAPGGGWFSFSYPGEILSSIHINGISNFYGSADCAVFGFKYEQSQTPNIDALRIMYVSSPSGVTPEDLAKKSVTKPIAVSELTAHASAENWDAQRQDYRSYLKLRQR